MVDEVSRLRAARRTLLIFGPQALSYRSDIFAQLRASLTTSSNLSWIRHTLADLPQYLDRALDRLPALDASKARSSLNLLSRALTTGNAALDWTRLPNVVLTPLVVATHLVQYLNYTNLTGQPIGVRQATSGRDVQVIGLCPGLLSAAAISCSNGEDDLPGYGSAAIRLAMLIGAFVDADNVGSSDGPWQSQVVTWNSVEEEKAFKMIMTGHPDAYISVIYDQNRVTVTALEKTMGDLQTQLRSAGLVVKAVSLFGRFHSSAHEGQVQALSTLCEDDDAFRIDTPSQPILSNGEPLAEPLTTAILRSILSERADWLATSKAVCTTDAESFAICFGHERCIPPSVFRSLASSNVLNVTDMLEAHPGVGQQRSATTPMPMPRPHASDDDIAVVGMACKFANADSLDQLWDVLMSGKSQHQELPEDRFEIDTIFRPEMTKKQKWFANFLRDHDSFDHSFFKKSPREAASMDPQQRLFLMVAYQALEQSGYFSKKTPEKHVGCYVGCCSQDYQTNIACHDPNAYTATGNLSSFIAGKVSWQFGWTGPAMVIDTACSSSAVAIHTACRAIISGDCKQALAGGSLVMTSPLWWHNLSGASFLNSTGNCKPFDEGADGYCRGEGVAGVVLKKMSDAIADGDQIFGCIAATAVLQNENCTPIVVPNAPSLSTLFTSVLERAGLQASDITVAEAHGTGTPVGDPAEWDSLRRILGGRQRQDILTVGSVKGHIGHTECTSGAAALLKVLLMLHYGHIPAQASFQKLSPRLKSTSEDMMQVLTSTQSWDASFRAALINNYGASGSNASMIVTQPFWNRPGCHTTNNVEHPICLSGPEVSDIRRNVARLLEWIDAEKRPVQASDLAFNLSRRINRSFPTVLAFTAATTDGVVARLQSFVQGDESDIIREAQSASPVVLCFGGQISTHVGLDRAVYERFGILRKHLDECDAVATGLGLDSIFPHIFEREPIRDVVILQTSLFAMQYACARSWIDSGVAVSAAVGHSFGELTALCICGILSLSDTIKVVARRARLVRDCWGPESGAMMAIEGSLDSLHTVLETAASYAEAEGEVPATIACYNSPTSFTIAGSEKAIAAVSRAVSSQGSTISRTKKLNVSNAFHSTLVEPLLPELNKVMDDVTVRHPQIPLLHSSDAQRDVAPDFIARHLRQPVYFSSAIRRALQQFPGAVFLEAGSNSTITNMASKALGSPKDTLFQAVNITSSNVVDNICHVTQNLRKAGVPVDYWAHNACQTYEYDALLLPPYQFAKHRHWLDLKRLPDNFNLPVPALPSQAETAPTKMWTFIGYQDRERSLARFLINTQNKEYDEYLTGHVIAEEAPICPATLQLDLVVEAISALCPDLVKEDFRPVIRQVENQAPICKDPSRAVFLDLSSVSQAQYSWTWKIFSEASQNSAPTTHVTGNAVLRRCDDKDYQLDFARFERLVGHRRCRSLLTDESPDDLICGRNIYRAFDDVVRYGEVYRGVRKLVGKGFESAGRVTKVSSGNTWFDGVTGDCFCQIGGIYVNCMTDRPSSSLYIANAIEQWIRSPQPVTSADELQSWDVFATHQQTSPKSYCTDIFVFDSATGVLCEVILGIHYAEVSKTSMRRLLSRNTPQSLPTESSFSSSPAVVAGVDRLIDSGTNLRETSQASVIPKAATAAKTPVAAESVDIVQRLKGIIADLCGLKAEKIRDNAQLADLGIDSLMAMELCKEIETAFECEIGEDEREAIEDFPSLVSCVRAHGSETQSSELDEISSNCGSVDSYSTSPSSVSDHDSSEVNAKKDDTAIGAGANPGLSVPGTAWVDAFREINGSVDDGIADCGFADYLTGANVKQTELCVSMILEAFAKLGCDLRNIAHGAVVPVVAHVRSQEHLVNYCYGILESEADLIRRDGSVWLRTSSAVPTETSDVLLEKLHAQYPDHRDASQLAYFCGSRYAEVFQGKDSGVKMMFGTKEGQDLVSKLYGTWPLNFMYYHKMASFLENVAARLPVGSGPLKILEMGGGTAGTTKVLLPRLAKLNVPIEYTFTDLSPAFCAQARKRFAQYDFVQYRAHNIEKAAPADLVGSQHVVIASNAVHATHDLAQSLSHIRQFLREDGILLMLEMTSPVCFIDIIFGLFEGWWMFSDDREHAVCHEDRWKRVMRSVGYPHTEWTHGYRPEHRIEKIIMGMATEPRYELPPSIGPDVLSTDANPDAREAVIDAFVRKYTHDWASPPQQYPLQHQPRRLPSMGHVVLVTGATGSLGAHMVAHAACLPEVSEVICVNRKSREDAAERQRASFEERGINLEPHALAKLTFLATDTSLPHLGLPEPVYTGLAQRTTHICHNAWPMSATRALAGFEPQFLSLRQLLDLASLASCYSPDGHPISFQLISSIAVVGHQPLHTGRPNVPETRMPVRDVLPNGYGLAKLVCERMLDATLHTAPASFVATVVRPGQIAGSAHTGHWNTHEHLSFLVRSCQTLGALPALSGPASWTPVDVAAAACVELLTRGTTTHSSARSYPVYHIDNPIRQPWAEILDVWVEELGLGPEAIVPFPEWVRRVREYDGRGHENPAAKLVDFLDEHFLRMSCGGLLMATARSCEHSPSLAALGPVSMEVVRGYFKSWRERKWLR